MYNPYEMNIILYKENFFITASGLDEGVVEGPDLPVLEDDE